MTDAQRPRKRTRLWAWRPSSTAPSQQQQQDPQPLTLYQRYFTRPVPGSNASLESLPPPAAASAVAVSTSSTDSLGAETTLAREKQTHASPVIAAADAPSPRRRFSLLSRGALALIALFLVIVVLAVVLPVTLTRQPPSYKPYAPDTSRSDPTLGALRGGTNATGNPLTPNNRTDALAYRFSQPPVRLALLANFPDPSILYHENSSTWWAYGTNGNAGILNVPQVAATDPRNLAGHANIQVATSTDFVKWTLHDAKSDPLPNPGAWAKSGVATVTTSDPLDSDDTPGSRDGPGIPDRDHDHDSDDDDDSAKHAAASVVARAATAAAAAAETTRVGPLAVAASTAVDKANVWAPDVVKHPSQDKFLMYYSAAAAEKSSAMGSHHCVGAAIADSPAGPFEPNNDPVACPLDQGGAIDPIVVVDPEDKSIYMVYKIDGNSMGHGGECLNTVPPIVPTPIMLQKMLPDGITRDSSFAPRQLLDRTHVDGPLIEAPAVVKVDDKWYMFYSSGCTRNPSYDVRYATADSVLGPWKRSDTPLLRTKDFGLLAPGSVTVKWVQPGSPSHIFSESEGDQANEKAASGWKIALHARVHTDKGGVRAVFTAGLAFDVDTATVTLIPGLDGEPASGPCTGECLT